MHLLLLNQQEHLFVDWDESGVNDELKHQFFSQISNLHRSYPSSGGLSDYIRNAKNLLGKAKIGTNPFDGWTPSVPSGISLEDPTSESYLKFEKIGLQHIGQCGFILVAGGLGERLGFSGIKVALPVETTTNTSYMEHYCRTIINIQERYGLPGLKLPLAIMLSDDTFIKTVELLDKNGYFGLDVSQVTLLKQEKVAALLDNDASIAKVSKYEIDSKPHGHGDVHALMYSTGTAEQWAKQGIEWCFFFQDTNGLAFFTLAAQLGVSVKLGLDVNSMTIPRKAKEPVGAITKLTTWLGKSLTINVEYNQLDPLLRATVSQSGDVNDPRTGYSPYPGNINQLIFRLEPYIINLHRKSGIMAEFVNPKYSDSQRTIFKKPTRLECMMQDYPKCLEDVGNSVGFTSAPAWLCFSPCKNNTTDAAITMASGIAPFSAYSAESDQYFVFCEILRKYGANITSAEKQEILGISEIPGPRLVIKPSCAIFSTELLKHFPNPINIEITSKSSLILDGDIIINNLQLDGYLEIIASKNTRIIVQAGTKQQGILNNGSELKLLDASNQNEIDKMRGYIIEIKKKLIIKSPENPMNNEIKVYVFNGRNLIPNELYDDNIVTQSCCVCIPNTSTSG